MGSNAALLKFKGLYEFTAAIYGIYDDTESQFAVFTAVHPPSLNQFEILCGDSQYDLVTKII